jgi:hypothetical protein
MMGDKLARGFRSAQFGLAPSMSQERWDALWEPEPIEAAKSEVEDKTVMQVEPIPPSLEK